MTPREAAMLAVVEAAKNVLRNTTGDKAVARITLEKMRETLLALDALPAEPPKTEGEMVEAFADKESGEVRWCVVGERLHDDLKTHWAYRRLSRPIAATVEPAP
ncbi:MAG: hypothetical protein ACEQSH_00285 [Bacteroidia bacterium]